MMIQSIRDAFPILHTKVNDKPLVYLDNGATSQKPQVVIDAIQAYYQTTNSNIHRGAHFLADKATRAYEDARSIVRRFVGAGSDKEINFTSGTTESINIVASCFGEGLSQGDEILISAMEHHSNIVPWQMLCKRKGLVLKVIPIDRKGQIIWDSFLSLLNEKTKLVSIVYISNALGTINPVEDIIFHAHKFGAKVLLDAAQAAPHLPLNVKRLNCDFLAFSAHKVFGPTGVGVLYAKQDLLEQMPPYKGGGEMIKHVSFEETIYNELPYKFEAGTPNICGGIATGVALEYMSQIGHAFIQKQEKHLLEYATDELSQIPDVEIIGQAPPKASVISFIIRGIHNYDIGVLLNKMGIAIRTGHHCCQPLMQAWNIEGTCRVSFAFYNTIEEIDILIKAIHRAKKMLL